MNKHLSLAIFLIFTQSVFGAFIIKDENLSLLDKVFMKNGNYIDITINNRHFGGNRPWEVRWNIIQNAYQYKNLKVLDLGCFLGINSICIKKYGEAKSVTGVDYTINHLKQAEILARAFEVDNVNFVYANFNDTEVRYEDILGYDYDIVFCMSLIHWIHDQKERLLTYLSKFDKLIFEGHEPAEVEIKRFEKYGFNAKLLGFAENKRPLIFFYKNALTTKTKKV